MKSDNGDGVAELARLAKTLGGEVCGEGHMILVTSTRSLTETVQLITAVLDEDATRGVVEIFPERFDAVPEPCSPEFEPELLKVKKSKLVVSRKARRRAPRWMRRRRK